MKNKSAGLPCTPEGLNAFKLGLVGENLSHLMGRILTVVDASTEGAKNMAMKDLIKKEFSEKQMWFSELAFKELEEVTEGHAPAMSWEQSLVPFEQGKKYSFKG